MKADAHKCKHSEQPQEKPISKLRVAVSSATSEMLGNLSLNE